jgi:hypothetical protein
MADRDQNKLPGAPNVNRRGLLKCMGWMGTGVVWTLSGGVPRTLGLIGDAAAAEAPKGELTFVQISDSHIGFHLPPNPDPTATLTEAIDKIKAMPTQPAFLIHTGDISHLSKEEEWDTADQVIKSANKQVFFIPGEHDVADADNGKGQIGLLFTVAIGRYFRGCGTVTRPLRNRCSSRTWLPFGSFILADGGEHSRNAGTRHLCVSYTHRFRAADTRG